jgi:hypothetical protein
MAAWFCLAGGFKVNVFKVNVFTVNVFKVNGYFVLPFGPPEQGRQSPRPCTPAIRQTQPPAAGGYLRRFTFLHGPLAIRSIRLILRLTPSGQRKRCSKTLPAFLSAQRSLVPPSMAEHPEMFISSAFVMPPQGQPPSQNPKLKI